MLANSHSRPVSTRKYHKNSTTSSLQTSVLIPPLKVEKTEQKRSVI